MVEEEICASEAVVEKGSKLSLQAAGTRALPERLIFRAEAPPSGLACQHLVKLLVQRGVSLFFPLFFRHPPSEVQLPTIAIDSILSLKVSFH